MLTFKYVYLANLEQVSAPRGSQPMRSTLQRDRGCVNVATPPTVLGGVPVVPYVAVYPSTLWVPRDNVTISLIYLLLPLQLLWSMNQALKMYENNFLSVNEFSKLD